MAAASSAEWRVCAVSAVTGEGLEELRESIESVVSGGEGLHLEEPVLASERQRGLVGEAFARDGSRRSATAALESDEELVCEDIREAIRR